jgi:hypothetical protein
MSHLSLGTGNDKLSLDGISADLLLVDLVADVSNTNCHVLLGTGTDRLALDENLIDLLEIECETLPPEPGGGGGKHHHPHPHKKPKRKDDETAELRKAYGIIVRNAKRLSKELRQEVLDLILADGPRLPPSKDVDFAFLASRPQYLKQAEDVFARAIVGEGLPEPAMVTRQGTPIAEIEKFEKERRHLELLDDEEDLILLLS